jgi:hypothetical protein
MRDSVGRLRVIEKCVAGVGMTDSASNPHYRFVICNLRGGGLRLSVADRPAFAERPARIR